jgi:hypothetical protein
MNPAGAIFGVLLGLLLLATASIAPPLLVIFSSRRLGPSRWLWGVATVLPGALLWLNLRLNIPLTKPIPPWAYVAVTLLVYICFRRFTRHLEPLPVAAAIEGP